MIHSHSFPIYRRWSGVERNLQRESKRVSWHFEPSLDYEPLLSSSQNILSTHSNILSTSWKGEVSTFFSVNMNRNCVNEDLRVLINVKIFLVKCCVRKYSTDVLPLFLIVLVNEPTFGFLLSLSQSHKRSAMKARVKLSETLAKTMNFFKKELAM